MKKWIPMFIAVLFAAGLGLAGPGISGGGSSAGIPLSGGTATGPINAPIFDGGLLNIEGSATLGRAGGTVTLGVKGNTSTVSLGADTINLEANSIACLGTSPVTECAGYSTKTSSTAGFTANTTVNNCAFKMAVAGARNCGSAAGVYWDDDGTTITFHGPISINSAASISGLGAILSPSIGLSGAAGSFSNVSMTTNRTAPTINSGFGGTPSIASNNGTAAFTVNVGSGGATSTGVIGLPTATNGWVCICDDLTTPGVNETKMTAQTTASCTLTNFNTTTGGAANWAANDILHCIAMGR